MSQRLHARRPAPYFGNQAAHPIDRKDSNAGRALGGLLAFGALTFGLIIGWHALFTWIGGVV